jgi:hypothetical protein
VLNPKPIKTTGAFNLFENILIIGIEPPSLTNTVFLPNAFSIPLEAALVTFESKGVKDGGAPCKKVIFTFTDLGATLLINLLNCFTTLFGFWLGTSLMLTFAEAFEGIIVFAPSPVNPEMIPLQSREGLIQVLSIAEKPFSPCNSFTLISLANFFYEKFRDLMLSFFLNCSIIAKLDFICLINR